MSEFFSAFSINQDVEFRPMYRHQQAMGIADEEISGRIVAVRFTEEKVFYDVLSTYHGKVFDNVDSGKVSGLPVNDTTAVSASSDLSPMSAEPINEVVYMVKNPDGSEELTAARLHYLSPDNSTAILRGITPEGALVDRKVETQYVKEIYQHQPSPYPSQI